MRPSTILISALLTVTILTTGCTSKKSSNSHSTTQSNGNHLKVASTEDPFSLDPRLVRDLYSATIMRMLYEGLTRMDNKGVPVPALAEKIAISDDLKTYTFTLRNSTWSDGTPLTAQDFAETWKSVLSPNFPAPNAYQLYVIKCAKAAKEGRFPVDDVGIKAIDPHTLVVELDRPTPYFLELTSCHFFFPVATEMRTASAVSANTHFDHLSSNGPFKLDDWKQRSEFSVVKNPNYWDAAVVNLDRITLQVLDENTALQLFKSGDLDWAGSPLSTLPQDAIQTLKAQDKLQIAQGAGTHWFRFNTERPPFNNEKLRRAFGLALDRQAIVDHVTQGNQLPALGILPPALGIVNQYSYTDHDVKMAQILFQGALQELQLSADQLPKISLNYAATDRNHKIAQAVQQQWNTTFGINVNLESTESQSLFDKMRNGFYQISLGSWYADIQDPINFLEIFMSRENPTNQTFWQNGHYTKLLEASNVENNPTIRLQQMADAEKLLIASMPVAPLFHNAFNYLKNPKIQGVQFSPLGYLDFKQATLASTPPTK